MSDALAFIGLLALLALPVAGAMLPATRRQRLYIGGVGLIIGVCCQLCFDGNVHLHVEVLLGMIAGYSVAIAALIAEILRGLVRRLWVSIGSPWKSRRTMPAAKE